jgi:hypothetical protein
MLPMKLLDWIDINKLNWDKLSENPNAIDLLKKNKNNINWYYLSLNPNAIEILRENKNIYLSNNKDDFEFKKNNKNIWQFLSENPNAINLLKENQHKIDWYHFSSNPSIFTYDYYKMCNNNLDLKEELIAKALHPKRIFKLIEKYGEKEIYDIYFDD